MGKIFWIGCGVALIGAIGLWVGGTYAVRGEAEKLKKEVDKNRDELRSVARQKEIVNQSFIDEVNKHKVKLGSQEGSLVARMRERDIDLSDKAFGDSPPPRESVAEFRLWLTGKYNDRDGLLRNKGIAFPQEERGMLDDVVAWEEVKPEHIPRILREYVTSEVVFRALADAEATATYSFVDDRKRPAENRVKEKVVVLNELMLRAARSGGAPAPRVEKDRFTEHSFTVSFIAHYSVAIDVMRRLGKSDRGLFIVRAVNIKRLPPERVDRVDSQELPPEMVKARQPYLNTGRKEAPVNVQLRVGLLDFPDAQEGG